MSLPIGFTRGAVVAGGDTIGPRIVGNKNNNLQINVVNNLDDDTMLQSTSIMSLHWHGFFQQSTNWADGMAFVNQCPIAKGNSFLYDFTATDQAGTFWYHYHLSTQYCDGLRGPIVIYDPDDPHASLYDVDDESTVITLADQYHMKAKEITFGTPGSTLINGLGRWSQGNETDLSVITVTSGQRYRVRLINTACDAAYTFSIDNHTMTVIEADAVNIEPIEVDSLMIYAGQHYSFVLNVDQAVRNYWIRANANIGTMSYTSGINSAILRYDTAEEEEPDVLDITSTNPLSEADLVPLENPGAPGDPVVGGVDYALHLNFAFTSTATFTVNDATLVPPTVPVLLQILSGGLLGLEHPIHLHGHNFDVVRVAGSTEYNYENPIRRDVVNAGSTSDNVTIRFTTDNPGPWILHCHVDWHLEAGFAIVFAEATDEWVDTIDPSDGGKRKSGRHVKSHPLEHNASAGIPKSAYSRAFKVGDDDAGISRIAVPSTVLVATP
uniref:Laccase n=1 Tax=Moniliophthora roreri TaxID=221103 RepID=A0A0W0EWH1_MONRR